MCGSVYSLTLPLYPLSGVPTCVVVCTLLPSPCTCCQEYVCGGVYSLTLPLYPLSGVRVWWCVISYPPPVPAVRITCAVVCTLLPAPCTCCQEYVWGGVYSLTLPLYLLSGLRVWWCVLGYLPHVPAVRILTAGVTLSTLYPCTCCQDYVCGGVQRACSWGSAVAVGAAYVYVSQPRLQRVLVVSRRQQLVVDVVQTDKLPVQLHYVPHLDQVGSCDCTGGRWGLQV